MKKYINLAFLYGMLAIACGVFYREFTKYLGFSGKTALAFTHVHLFALGTMLFLLIGVLTLVTDLAQQKLFRRFLCLYNIGLPFMVAMFFVRGIPQALGVSLSAGASAAISGVAGIAHILVTVSFVLLFLALKKSASIVKVQA